MKADTLNLRLLIFVVMFAFLVRVYASPRTSTSYSISIDTADSGGTRTTSANYTNDGSTGGVVGISTVASPVETAKNGYIGQLYEVTGLQLAASPTTVNEGATLQLGAAQLLDDLTTLAVNTSSVSWGVVSGPIASIDTTGLAAASTVYQDTSATVQGSYAGNLGTLNLTVINVNNDDFGSYAGDGIDDAWQVQYFGQPPNAKAGPNADADGTGQTNRFKFIAGLNPLDGSRFLLTLNSQANQKNVIFTPINSGRTYMVQYKTSLTGSSWSALTGTTQSDNGSTRTVSDPGATGPKFYRVQISKP